MVKCLKLLPKNVVLQSHNDNLATTLLLSYLYLVVMGCAATRQNNTEEKEVSIDDAEKIVERVYSAKKGNSIFVWMLKGKLLLH